MKFVFQTDMPGLKAEKNICIAVKKKKNPSVTDKCLVVKAFRFWVEYHLKGLSNVRSNNIKFLPKKSQMKTFLKSRGDLKPCWKTCSRAQTRPYSPQRRRVRLPLCGEPKEQKKQKTGKCM